MNGISYCRHNNTLFLFLLLFLLLLLYASIDVEFPDRNLYDFYMYDVVPTILFHRDGGDGGGNANGGSSDGRQWMLYQIEGSLR